ncbi:MAG: type I-C CRISPR-associated protein Cas8c/Csd1 [Spartobacteria bacterium]|nr:type I-C CRISPR-associated protein Cas8c/Csd1 [Spartobacteria bacterium]
MILKALADYYERLLDDPACNIAPPGFERKAIPFLIVINRNGDFVNLRDTRTGEGKKKSAREFLVPQGEKKAAGIKANLLWDNPEYVFGVPKSDSDRDKKRAQDAFFAFKKRISDTFPSDFADEGLQAVRKFIKNADFSYVSAKNPEIWAEIVENRPNLSFVLENDDQLIAQRGVIVEFIKKSNETDGESCQACAVTGELDVPASLHTAIKGVWGAQTSGANIVSFNLSAFCSFGKKQGLNAPIGHKAETAYTKALNHLLRKGSRQRIQVGDASTVFWAKQACPFEEDFSFFLGSVSAESEEDASGKLRSLFNAVKTGVTPIEDDLPFFVLGLAPNAARIAVRFWCEGSIRDFKERIVRHFGDIAIVRAPHDREFLSLFMLLTSTATEGKADNIPPNLGGDLMRAVLTDAPYPRTLLANAIRRCKAEQRVTHPRAAIIKGVLERDRRMNRTNEKEEIHMSLDKDSVNIGYVLGRLFAVLERIQEQAQTGLNKTIRDTYFGAACSSPLVTFKRLQDLAVHHLAKIRNSGKSTVWLDKLLQEVMDKLPSAGLPATLTLEDQGRFAIGYYHQRQDFFTKKEQEPSANEGEKS